jgi:hypothetical protein
MKPVTFDGGGRNSGDLWVPPKIVETSIFIGSFVGKGIFR